MARSKEIRVGVLGRGLAGGVFHGPLIERVPGLELIGVAGSADAGALLAEDLDVVVVATPNRTHASLAIAALEAGRHVVIDKPVARSAAEAREIQAAARNAGRLAIPFHNRRWDADFLTLRRLLADGALGTVWRFESRFERWRPEVVDRWRESGDPDDAGGVLYDLAPHLIDQALVLFGPAELVTAEAFARRSGAEAVDDAFLILRHTSGPVAHLWVSAAAADAGPRFRVLGSRAAFVKHGLDAQEDALKAGAWSGEEPPAHRGVLVGADSRTPVASEPGGWPEFYGGVAAAIRGTAPAPVELADAIAGLEILDAARQACGRSQ